MTRSAVELAANYGVSRAATAEQSLEQLPAQLRPLADQLGLRLVSLVKAHPERTYETATKGVHVYQHPHPLIEIEYVESLQAGRSS